MHISLGGSGVLEECLSTGGVLSPSSDGLGVLFRPTARLEARELSPGRMSGGSTVATEAEIAVRARKGRDFFVARGHETGELSEKGRVAVLDAEAPPSIPEPVEKQPTALYTHLERQRPRRRLDGRVMGAVLVDQ